MIIQGDTIEVMKQMIADGIKVQTCVTSPPYWGLRDYGVAGQLGLEDTPEEFVANMVKVFSLVKELLTDDGTLWLNLGDSYYNYRPGRGQALAKQTMSNNKQDLPEICPRRGNKLHGLKQKDLIGIPWKVAFALQSDGWYLRQDIIWAKPNPMPESVRDRCTKSHEYIFLLSKSPVYYFDQEAIKEQCTQDEMANGFRGGAYINGETFDNAEGGKRKNTGNYRAGLELKNSLKPKRNIPVPSGWDNGPGSHRDIKGRYDNGVGFGHGTDKEARGRDRVKKSGNKERKSGAERGCPEGTGSNVCGSVPWEGNIRNKRSVWTVATQPYKEAHFATFPEKLIEPCILAGAGENEIVFDPFNGAGTTGLVAFKNRRKYIGIELNPDYVELSNKRFMNLQVKML